MGRINRRRDRWTKRALEAVVRPFVRRPPMDLEAIRARDPRRILIVRQHNQMGDMLCAVPVFRSIRRTFPGCTTMLVTAPINDGVVRNNPYLDHILLFDKVELRSSPRAAWRFLRELRGFGADLAIVPTTVSFSSTSAWLAVLSGAPVAIGGDSEPFGWSFSRWLYNLVLPSSRELEGHAIDHGLRPLAEVGFEVGDRSTLVVPGEEAEVEAREFLAGEVGPRPFALHPGAGKVENRWPAERFAQVARELARWGLDPWVVEGPADGPATREMLEAHGAPLPVFSGRSLRAVSAALGQSRLALVNDTGVMHVAGAMGVPTLALFGPTPAASWQPPSPALEAIQAPDGNMGSIATGEVVERLARLAARHGLPAGPGATG